MKFRLLMSSLLIVAGGCALSPQTLMLRPFIDVYAEQIGRGRPLTLQVLDRRPSPDLGLRGGVYPTAVISPRGDVTEPLYAALAERLQASGFVVVAAQGSPTTAQATEPAGREPLMDSPGMNSSETGVGEPSAASGPALTVQLRQLVYTARPDPLVIGSLLNEIRIDATLSATVTSADGIRSSGVYQANSVQRRIGYPSAAENEELVNNVIAQALQRLLLDPELRALLAR